VHFNVLRERGMDTRLERIDEAAPLYYLSASIPLPRLLLICYEDDLPCRVTQNRLMLESILHFQPDAPVGICVLPGGHVAGSTKVDENGDPLEGAEFTLEKELKDGSRKLVDLVTVKNATFSFTGLDDGDYVLTETKAPEGYRPMIAPIRFTVTAGHAVVWETGSEEVVEKVSEILNKLVKDGTIQKIFEEHNAPYTAPEV